MLQLQLGVELGLGQLCLHWVHQARALSLARKSSPMLFGRACSGTTSQMAFSRGCKLPWRMQRSDGKRLPRSCAAASVAVAAKGEGAQVARAVHGQEAGPQGVVAVTAAAVGVHHDRGMAEALAAAAGLTARAAAAAAAVQRARMGIIMTMMATTAMMTRTLHTRRRCAGLTLQKLSLPAKATLKSGARRLGPAWKLSASGASRRKRQPSELAVASRPPPSCRQRTWRPLRSARLQLRAARRSRSKRELQSMRPSMGRCCPNRRCLGVLAGLVSALDAGAWRLLLQMCELVAWLPALLL